MGHGLGTNNFIDNKNAVASPRYGALVFFIVKVEIIAAVIHQVVCNAIICNGEFKFV